MKHALPGLFLTLIFALASCGSPTTPKPSFPVSLTGGGSAAGGSIVTIHAVTHYSGSNSLSYKWAVNGQATSVHDQTTYYSASAGITQNISVIVSSGDMEGTASTSVTYH